MNELMTIKQLPVIEEQLQTLSAEIDNQIAAALKLPCNEETVKEIKKIRAELKKDSTEYETGRKAIKSAILKPYEDFETVYKKYVGDKYTSADAELKKRIDTIENQVKAKNQVEAEIYFNEYVKSKNIDFITFANTGITVTLSASMKSLKDQTKAFIDRVAEDIAMIETQEYKDEIMVEYKQNLRAAFSITTVKNRHKAIEEEKARTVEVEQIKQQEQTVIENVNHFAPPVEEEPEIQITFKVWGTRTQLRAVKEFIEKEGIRYE
jgi:hypothetical protein